MSFYKLCKFTTRQTICIIESFFLYFRKNFLQVDIFYSELSYEVITQQKAFEFESLLGEIGGCLGLLLGMYRLGMGFESL